MRPRLIAIIAYLATVAALGVGVWWVALGAALGQLEDRGQADLKLASDRLVSELQSYRELAVLLADHVALVALLDGGNSDIQGADDMLLRMADRTGSLEIVLLDRAGAVVAQSHRDAHPELRNMGETSYFKRAIRGALGMMHWQFGDQRQRAYTFAAPVFGMDRKPVGAVAVSVDLEQVEASWRAAPQVVFFTDEAGVIFVSNRAEMLFRTREPLNEVRTRKLFPGQYDPSELRDFYDFDTHPRGAYRINTQDISAYLPARSISVTLPVPVMDLVGEVMVASDEAEQLALYQALVAVGLGLTFGAVILFYAERRRGVMQRLEVEAEANARLEARVAERTAALQQAQQDLVQAGKLSALGQMSAGISHELNQPLMAIRSYAENGEEFLRRGKPDVAGENLGRISDLARRMGRIIKNLRAFARQETEPLGRVDLAAVIDSVLELSEVRLRDENVKVERHVPQAPVYIYGGEVRLSQVLVNLVGNALDAMEGQSEKHLTVSVTVGENVEVSVRDNGPGLADPEKIFDPFYTTKEVGRSEGMGLGLSISYGIVQSFGGNIRGRNHQEGGAIVTVELTPAGAQEIAA